MTPGGPPGYHLPPLALAAVLAAKQRCDLRGSALAGVSAAPGNLALAGLLAAPRASAASHLNLWLWGGLAVLTLGAWQLAACWLWPFADCGKCSGSGKLYGPSGILLGTPAFKTCGRCGGTGKRVRTGRRFVDQFREVRARAK